ncbi:coiled-coil domain-containing protein 42 [Camarhynchus parvulus]|uniref:coiled-coil domain-containing protein 42 n=1 Tax=Geospiza parvula TaxID=87175 RepID=UPI001238065B|nr:coiled-coil domain-containing protein 42 [Camarhynchus parvulus]
MPGTDRCQPQNALQSCTMSGKCSENERLRTQALKKAKEEKEENLKKESELLRARRELEALRKKHQKLSKKLVKYSRFKRYLEDVVENSQFPDIDDIISYYKAILRTRKDLLQSQWWHRQLMEQGKGLQQQLRAGKEAEILQCRNDLVQLKESFDQAQSDIRQWEDRWAQVQDRQARKAVELRSLTMAIHGLFHAASARLQPQGRVAAGDSHRQLDMIRQFIHDLQDFTEDMKERGRAL